MTDPMVDLALRLGIVAAAGAAVSLFALGSRVWRERRRHVALLSRPTPELTRGEPTVLLFSGALCADCTQQKAILVDIRQGLGGGWRLREVQAAAELPLARRFGVESVPATVVLDSAGRPAAVNYGLVDGDTLSRQLAALLSKVAQAI